jgi:hypothetical protein
MRNERGSQYESKAREAWATPVKIVQYNCTCGKTMKFVSENGVIAPQRTWVGLTDEQVEKIIKANMSFQMNLAGIRQDFEAAYGIKE